jgi:hypothetical protein
MASSKGHFPYGAARNAGRAARARSTTPKCAPSGTRSYVARSTTYCARAYGVRTWRDAGAAGGRCSCRWRSPNFLPPLPRTFTVRAWGCTNLQQGCPPYLEAQRAAAQGGWRNKSRARRPLHFGLVVWRGSEVFPVQSYHFAGFSESLRDPASSKHFPTSAISVALCRHDGPGDRILDIAG